MILLLQEPSVLQRAHVIDWAVVGGILTLAAGFIVHVILPAWLRYKTLQRESGSGTTTTVKVNGNGSASTEALVVAEWRGKQSAHMEQQDKKLDALVAGTTAIEKVVLEIERRSQGQDNAIREIAELIPKVDTILAITKRRMRRKQ